MTNQLERLKSQSNTMFQFTELASIFMAKIAKNNEQIFSMSV